MKISRIILLSMIVLISSCKKDETDPLPASTQKPKHKKFNSLNSPLVNISTDYLQCVEIDANNNIWMGTRDAAGLLKYNPTNDSWVGYYKAEFGADIWAILDIDFGSDGSLWIGTNGGVFNYSNSSFSKVLVDSSGFANSWASTIHVDQQDRVWAAMNSHIYCLKNGNWSLLTQYDSLFNYQIQDIKSDSQGNIWIGTFQGLVKFDGNSFSLINSQSVSSNLNIYNIHVKDNDSLIIGCIGGLYRFVEPNYWSAASTTSFQNPVYDRFEWLATSAAQNDSSIIHGTWNMGLSFQKGNEFTFMRGNEFQIDTNKFQINHLKYDQLGNLWIATRFGELIAYNPTGLEF